MFKKILFIDIALIIFYFSTDRLFTVEEREMLKYIIILIIIITMALAPSMTAKEQEKSGEFIDRQWDEGEYHNDFQRVPKASNAKPVKPIDLSGDAIKHANETLDEDLKQLGLEKKE